MVAFNQIPGNILVPFFYAEINSGGTPYQGQSKILLLGQKLAGGTAPANVARIIQSEAEAAALFGAGSMLVDQYRVARRNAPFHPIWAAPLADPAGAAATGTITLNSAPAVTGVAVLRVMGRRILVQVYGADAVADVATKIAAAINADVMPVTAAAALGVVTLTARHVGTMGNFIDVKVLLDEPNVLTAANTTVVAMSGGTGVPVLTTALANLGDEEFDWINGPYADTVSLNAMRDFLYERHHPAKQIYGHYLTANFGTLSANVTLGNARDDPHVSIMATQASPTPPWEWAAALGAKAAQHLTDAPEVSRPLHTLLLEGILPPDDRSLWFDRDDRGALYVDGMSSTRVTVDGQVAIDRVRTTYQVTAQGVSDGTFGDVVTMGQVMFLVRYFRAEVSNRHARQALADENPYNVAEITTPRDIRNTLIHTYQALAALGVVEKPDLFAQFVVVERDLNDANRVNAAVPADVVNQLNVFAMNATINLQYRT